jgi:hypothetical protein
MTIDKRAEQAGVDVHLDPAECELFSRLAADAEKASGSETLTYADGDSTYFSLSLALGKKIRALAEADSTFLHDASERRPLARAMVDLILSDDPA